jgi:hypothetical protein
MKFSFKTIVDKVFGTINPITPDEPVIPELHGTTDSDKTEAALLSIVAMAAAFEEAAADGLTVADALPLLNPVRQTAGAFLHWREIGVEAADLTDTEVEALTKKIVDSLGDIDHESARVIAIRAALVLAPLSRLIRDVAAIRLGKPVK